MGLIVSHVNANPMDPESWQKRADPILKSGSGLFGPGHGSLTSDNWLVFHTAAYNGSGWTRQIRTQPFRWNEEEGIPVLSEIQDPNTPILLPPGEPQRQRYQLDFPLQNPTFDVEVDQNGWYILVMQARSKEHGNTTSFLLTVNQRVTQSIDVLYSDHWSSISVPVELPAGKNTFVFSNTGTTTGEIYSIDLLPRVS